MGRRLFVVFVIFISVMAMWLQLGFGQKNNIVSAKGKHEDMLSANYAINLIIETPKIKKNISLVVASKDFAFGQYFLNAFIGFEGKLEVEGGNVLLLDYQLGLREKAAGEDASTKTNENQWVENGCQGSLIVEENKEIIFFQAADRSYAVNISRFAGEKRGGGQ